MKLLFYIYAASFCFMFAYTLMVTAKKTDRTTLSQLAGLTIAFFPLVNTVAALITIGMVIGQRYTLFKEKKEWQ